MKPKIYIAGQISGDPGYLAKFRDAEKKLSDGGYAVLNPASLPEGMSAADYMRICFAMIDAADTVVFLPDYKKSLGAMLEMQYCTYIGKDMLVLSEEAGE